VTGGATREPAAMTNGAVSSHTLNKARGASVGPRDVGRKPTHVARQVQNRYSPAIGKLQLFDL
jgi:hypothetical protein